MNNVLRNYSLGRRAAAPARAGQLAESIRSPRCSSTGATARQTLVPDEHSLVAAATDPRSGSLTGLHELRSLSSLCPCA
jgi:hypothetical protein